MWCLTWFISGMRRTDNCYNAERNRKKAPTCMWSSIENSRDCFIWRDVRHVEGERRDFSCTLSQHKSPLVQYEKYHPPYDRLPLPEGENRHLLLNGEEVEGRSHRVKSTRSLTSPLGMPASHLVATSQPASSSNVRSQSCIDLYTHNYLILGTTMSAKIQKVIARQRTKYALTYYVDD